MKLDTGDLMISPYTLIDAAQNRTPTSQVVPRRWSDKYLLRRAYPGSP